MEFRPVYLCIITVFWCICALASGAFPKTVPISWSESKEIVTSGEELLFLGLTWKSPCEYLYDAKLVTGSEEYFKEWCKGQLQEMVIDPLIDICHLPDIQRNKGKVHQVKLSRNKRSAGIGKVVSFVIQTGLGLFGTITDLFTRMKGSDGRGEIKDKFQNTITEVENMDGQIKDIQNKQSKVTEVLMTFDSDLQNLATDIHHLNQTVEKIIHWKTDFTRTFPETITLVSYLSSYFSISRNNLAEVAREWKSGKFSLQLFDVFKIDPQTDEIEIFRDAKPKRCHISPSTGIAHFVFTKEFKHENLKIMTAHPFIMYLTDNTTEMSYKLEYIGPKDVIYDSKSGSVGPMSQGLIQVPQGETNLKKTDDISLLSQYWRKTCDSNILSDFNAEIQVQEIGDTYSIYCSGFSILVYKKSFLCPPYVFSHPKEEPIESIGGNKLNFFLKSGIQKLSSKGLSNKITYRLMPHINELDFEKIPTKCSILDTPVPLQNMTLVSVGVSFMSLFLIIFCILCIWSLVRKRKQEIQSRRMNTNSNEKLMSKIKKHESLEINEKEMKIVNNLNRQQFNKYQF